MAVFAQHPGCRISRVRPKNRALAEVVIVRPDSVKVRAEIMDLVRERLNHVGRGIGGFAFVVWDHDTASSAVLQVYPGNCLSRLTVPDFVRERLMAEAVLRWAEEDTRQMIGAPPPDERA